MKFTLIDFLNETLY